MFYNHEQLSFVFSPSQRKMNERRIAALKQDSSESESEDGATTYRSLAGMKGRETST